MKVIDILDKAYGRKKSNGEISSHSIKFIDKYELEMNKELSTVFEAMDIVMKLSKTMQLKVYDFVKSHFENIVEKKELTFKEVRTLTYKQVAKICHPDSDRGDNETFQMIQGMKTTLWIGGSEKPREEISGNDWEYEKFIYNGGTLNEWMRKDRAKIYEANRKNNHTETEFNF